MKTAILPKYSIGEKPEEKKLLDYLFTLNGCDVILTDSLIVFKRDENIIFESKLIEFERDQMFLTHVGCFENGIKFRIVQVIGFAKKMLEMQGRKPSFTIASLNPIGYSLDFEFI